MNFVTQGQFVTARKKKAREGEPEKHVAIFLCAGSEDTTQFNLPAGYDPSTLKQLQMYTIHGEFRTWKDQYYFNASKVAQA